MLVMIAMAVCGYVAITKYYSDADPDDYIVREKRNRAKCKSFR